MGAPLEALIQLFNQLNAYNKTYIVHCNQTVTEGRNIANALDILMISATKLAYSEKISDAKASSNTLSVKGCSSNCWCSICQGFKLNSMAHHKSL